MDAKTGKGEKKMKRKLAMLLALAVLLGTCAGARNLYDRFWLPGDYVLELAPKEQARYAEVRERVLSLSAGTRVREACEAETLELQYEKYLQLGEVPQRVYDDVGAYTWALGLPDEEAIAPETAYALACAALERQYGLTPEELAHYWPQYAYVTADPENPVWQVDFICYDGARNSTATVALYARDGSVCGVQYGGTAG